MQTDVQQAFLQYRYKAEASAGTISIFPMTEQDLAPTTELLTQSFAESMGYFSIYRQAPSGNPAVHALATISLCKLPCSLAA